MATTQQHQLHAHQGIHPTTGQPSKGPWFPSYDVCRVLILGCGNSTMGEEMLGDGWRGEIVNVDFSSVVIEQMKNKYDDHFYSQFGGHCPNRMTFLCADVTDPLPFPDQSFDLIICKGTLDAILCSSGSVAKAKNTIRECVRLLAYGHGALFLVSYGNPDSRVLYLEGPDHDLSFYWQEVSTHVLGRHSSSGPK